MHLVYLTQFFETGSDTGSDRHFYFCRHLVRRGHRATAITSNVDYKRAEVRHPGARGTVLREQDGVRIVYVYSYSSFRGSFFRRFWYFLTYVGAAMGAGLRVERPDVVYAVSTPLTVGLLGYLLSRARHVPFVFEVTDVWPDAALATGVVRDGLLVSVARWLEAFCYRKAALIVALTAGIRETIIGKGVPASKVMLATNGIDPALFPEEDAAGRDAAQAIRRTLHADGKVVCMYLGAHGAYNALGTILDAAEARRDNPRLLWVLLGDGDEKPRLQARAASAGLSAVAFVPPVARTAAADWLRAADVLLIPNRQGAFFRMNLPNKLFDFLASARPIVVAGEGETAAVVTAAGAGMAVGAEDGAAMARAVDALTEMSGQARAEIGAAGRR